MDVALAPWWWLPFLPSGCGRCSCFFVVAVVPAPSQWWLSFSSLGCRGRLAVVGPAPWWRLHTSPSERLPFHAFGSRGCSCSFGGNCPVSPLAVVVVPALWWLLLLPGSCACPWPFAPVMVESCTCKGEGEKEENGSTAKKKERKTAAPPTRGEEKTAPPKKRSEKHHPTKKQHHPQKGNGESTSSTTPEKKGGKQHRSQEGRVLPLGGAALPSPFWVELLSLLPCFRVVLFSHSFLRGGAACRPPLRLPSLEWCCVLPSLWDAVVLFPSSFWVVVLSTSSLHPALGVVLLPLFGWCCLLLLLSSFWAPSSTFPCPQEYLGKKYL